MALTNVVNDSLVDEIIFVGRIIVGIITLLGSSQAIAELVDSLDFKPLALLGEGLGVEWIKASVVLGLVKVSEDGSTASTSDSILNSTSIPPDKFWNQN
jgi:hypothetical protein